MDHGPHARRLRRAARGPAVAADRPPLKLEGIPSDRLPDRFTGVPGTWDLSRDGTNRRCVMTLGIDNGPVGRKLAFPAGCRRALPIKVDVTKDEELENMARQTMDTFGRLDILFM